MSKPETTSPGSEPRSPVLLPWIAWSGLVSLNAAINARSQIFSLQRNGVDYLPMHAWLMEGSSALFLIVMFAVPLYLARRFPLDFSANRWGTGLSYLVGALIYSLGHIGGMFAIRMLLWPVVFGFPYDGPSSIVENIAFEFQKDLIPFVVAAIGLHLFHSVVEARGAVRAAREDARSARTITLKCGVRTIYADADHFVWASSAANYADVAFDKGKFFARISLAELEKQLREAGIKAMRVHRSWLINGTRIRESRPSGDGGLLITLDTGDEIPVSRKYRDSIELRDA